MQDRFEMLPSREPSLSPLERISRWLLARHFRNLSGGQLHLLSPQGHLRLGAAAQDLNVEVQVHDPRFYRRAILGGDLGVAASYMAGDWSCQQLTQFVQLMIRNLDRSDQLNRTLASLRHAWGRLIHAWRRNSITRARRNIGAHYDLSNEFFATFLDPTLSYSCGLFRAASNSMHQASLAKMHRIARWLNISPSDHVLEIGSGWGGFALFLAQEYGAQVTTITISRQQYEYAQQRVAEAGLAHRVHVRLQDYRDVRGKFDKLVSIEMIEAVGHQYFDQFFRRCSELLTPEGLMFLQAIVIRDQRYQRHIRGIDFIRYYIFPGGCLPSTERLLRAMKHTTDLRILRCQDLSEHYVRTLQEWRAAFQRNQEVVQRLGFNLSFQRMWEYYLCYCEAAFRERQVGLMQMLFAKPRGALHEIPRAEHISNEFSTGSSSPTKYEPAHS